MSKPNAVVLWWLPVGSGGHVAVRTSRWWEWVRARREHRSPGLLVHSALEVTVDGIRHVIEMAPAWGGPTGDRGVVAEGPVGFTPLRRWSLFRYEVRCWRDGLIPDLDDAVGDPIAISDDGRIAAHIVDSVSRVPCLTWGRDPLQTGDMWNSNSLVAWLLRDAGLGAEDVSPPDGGRAPGWRAGLLVADGRGNLR